MTIEEDTSHQNLTNYLSPERRRGEQAQAEQHALNLAFNEGFAAAQDGLSGSSCPYKKDDEPAVFSAWHMGFRGYLFKL